MRIEVGGEEVVGGPRGEDVLFLIAHFDGTT